MRCLVRVAKGESVRAEESMTLGREATRKSPYQQPPPVLSFQFQGCLAIVTLYMYHGALLLQKRGLCFLIPPLLHGPPQQYSRCWLYQSALLCSEQLQLSVPMHQPPASNLISAGLQSMLSLGD